MTGSIRLAETGPLLGWLVVVLAPSGRDAEDRMSAFWPGEPRRSKRQGRSDEL